MSTNPELSPAPISKDLKKYQANWETNAKLDPLWAVLTLEGKLGNGWDIEAFFNTGHQEIEEVFEFMKQHSVALFKTERALDFGCGVGRLTQPLALKFQKVLGVDISEEMIRLAKQYFPHIQFHLNKEDDLSDFESTSFDFIYTNIVLQHLNSNLQKHYIREFSRLVRPGGLVVFQIPSRGPTDPVACKTLRMLTSLRPKNCFELMKRALTQGVLPWQARMELNILTKREVLETAKAQDLHLEQLGHINWKEFYDRNVFKLESADNELADQAHFPLSPLYFFRKVK